MTTEQILLNLLTSIEPGHQPIKFHLEGGYQLDENHETFWNPNHDEVYGTPLNPISDNHRFIFYLIPSSLSILSHLNMDVVTTNPYLGLGISKELSRRLTETFNPRDTIYWDTLLTYRENMKILIPSQLLIDLLQSK